MPMSSVKHLLGLLILLLSPLAGAAKPLPSDSRVVTKKLENGLTWMYRRHANPPGKMALMLHVDTGSLNETDAQRGLAHFIEHMCFNGSEHFPPGALIPYFESIGMEFGPDLNAFTSFDQTSYMLFLPDTELAQVEKALTVMSDYAYRVSFIEEEIEKERGVVLEESRTGKNAFQRIRDKLWPKLFEGSRFAQRLPIGEDEILASAPKKEFVDYYRAWYRPEHMTLILVGDAPHEPYEPLIEKWFGQHKPQEPARKASGAEFKPFTQERALVEADPEMAFCEVGLLNIRPGRPPTVTTEQMRTELVERLGSWMINRRYTQMVQAGKASFRDASAQVFNFFNEALLINGSATGEPQDWAKMLDELIHEIHRARQYGFTERELELARKDIMAGAERAVETEPTRDARSLLFEMLSAVNQEEPILSAQQALDLLGEFMPTITLAEVNETFRKHFDPGTFAYVIETIEKDGAPLPTGEKVLTAAKAAWARTIEKPEDDEGPLSLLAVAPSPGNVVESQIEEDLKITSAWLSNGVRVHHRFMDYKKDSVFVSISLTGGPVEENPGNAGISEVAALAVNEPATRRLTSSQVRDLMTGKNIEVRSGATGDNFTITVTGSPKDLPVGLELAHALLTEGRIEESAFKNWKLATLQRLDMLDKFPNFQGFKALLDIIAGSDPRLTFMSREKVETQSVEAAQAWFERLCRDAPIEAAIVGDIPKDEAMHLAKRYLGSLGSRPRTASHLDALRRLPRSTGPHSKHVLVDTVNPQGMAIAGFLACEGRNIPDRRALELASEVLSSRLVKRIREELSIVYSISARFQPSWIYRDSGTFTAGAPCDPKAVDRVIAEITELFDEFARSGPTEEELANAKKQIANNLDTSMREPGYWWDILMHHDLHERNLAEEKVEKQAFERYTAEQVKTTFARYYTPARRLQVTAVPAPAQQAGTPPAQFNERAPRE